VLPDLYLYLRGIDQEGEEYGKEERTRTGKSWLRPMVTAICTKYCCNILLKIVI